MSEHGTCAVCGSEIPGPFSGGHCNSCHQGFNSNYADGLHRRGEYGNPKNPRRCLTPDEMRERGMSLNARGLWVSKALRPESLAEIQDGPSANSSGVQDDL